jgi:hypothetical protein
MIFLKRARALDQNQVEDFFAQMSTQLQVYNAVLIFCGEAPQSTVTQCKQILKGYYLNIYDFKDNVQGFIFKSKPPLIKRCHQRGCYPKNRAKNEHLRALLRHLTRRSTARASD